MTPLLAAWLVAFAPQVSTWEPIYDKEGIQGFSQEISGAGYFGFKGIGTVDANVATVFNVIADVEHELEWVFLLKDHRVLSTPTQFERTEYQLFGLPWPASDRDFVFTVKASTIDTKGSVLIAIESVELPDPIPTRGVRGKLIKSSFLLEPLGPKRTLVTVEIFSDPRGLLPGWMVNFVQRRWPYETISGIRAQVRAPHAKEAALPPWTGPAALKSRPE